MENNLKMIRRYNGQIDFIDHQGNRFVYIEDPLYYTPEINNDWTLYSFEVYDESESAQYINNLQVIDDYDERFNDTDYIDNLEEKIKYELGLDGAYENIDY